MFGNSNRQKNHHWLYVLLIKIPIVLAFVLALSLMTSIHLPGEDLRAPTADPLNNHLPSNSPCTSMLCMSFLGLTALSSVSTHSLQYSKAPLDIIDITSIFDRFLRWIEDIKATFNESDQANFDSDSNSVNNLLQSTKSFSTPAMIPIEPGRFLMGEYASKDMRERYGRQEDISQKFEIGKFEITVGEFKQFADETFFRTDAEKRNNCKVLVGKNTWTEKSRNRSWRNPGFSQAEDHPVVCVSWNDTQKYIEWLNKKTKLHYRLPTEKEWEYVAREGSFTSRYWKNESANSDACEYANLYDKSSHEKLEMNYVPYECDDTFSMTAPVGKFKANKFGVHDMLGNVWEWVDDCHNRLGKAKIFVQDYFFSSCDIRVLKGGSFHYGPGNVYSGLRAGLAQEKNGALDGFRLARTLD